MQLSIMKSVSNHEERLKVLEALAAGIKVVPARTWVSRSLLCFFGAKQLRPACSYSTDLFAHRRNDHEVVILSDLV